MEWSTPARTMAWNARRMVPNHFPSHAAFFLLTALVALPHVGCGSPNAIGDAVRPPTPVASSVLAQDIAPDAIACRPHAYAEPLVIDMPTLWRADFEDALNKGVALVSYDCKSLKLVKACRLAGSYGFAGIDRLSDVIHLDDSTQIGANVPLPLGMSASASLDRSTALDVAYVLVGKRSTPASVLRSQLQGADCAAATHFVAAANVGSFAVRTATKGSGQVAANIFGASASAATSSGKETSKQAGDPSACDASQSQATTPPNNCGVAFKLELEPIVEAAATGAAGSSGAGDDKAKGGPKGEAEAKEAPDPCPDGFKLAAGKCAKVGTTSGPHLCDPKDRADCEAQCQAGDPGSCFNLATLVRYQRGSSDDRTAAAKRAVELDKRACDGGYPDGCWEYGDKCGPDGGSCTKPEAAAALDKGCNKGSSNACERLGWGYLKGADDDPDLGLTKDETKGTKLYHRACDLGDESGCHELADFFFNGWHVTRDPVAGYKLLWPYCDQGKLDYCTNLAYHLLGWETANEDHFTRLTVSDFPIKPVAEIPDALPRARAILAKACESDKQYCDESSHVLAEADDPDARTKLTSLCPDKSEASTTCGYLGESLFDGKGGPADKKAGFEMMARSPVKPLVLRVALLLKKGGEGVKKDAKRSAKMLKELCEAQWGYAAACDAQDTKGGKKAKK